jgi:hypothetical protein
MTAPIMKPTAATVMVMVSDSFIANDQDFGLNIGIHILPLIARQGGENWPETLNFICSRAYSIKQRIRIITKTIQFKLGEQCLAVNVLIHMLERSFHQINGVGVYPQPGDNRREAKTGRLFYDSSLLGNVWSGTGQVLPYIRIYRSAIGKLLRYGLHGLGVIESEKSLSEKGLGALIFLNQKGERIEKAGI